MISPAFGITHIRLAAPGHASINTGVKRLLPLLALAALFTLGGCQKSVRGELLFSRSAPPHMIEPNALVHPEGIETVVAVLQSTSLWRQIGARPELQDVLPADNTPLWRTQHVSIRPLNDNRSAAQGRWILLVDFRDLDVAAANRVLSVLARTYEERMDEIAAANRATLSAEAASADALVHRRLTVHKSAAVP